MRIRRRGLVSQPPDPSLHLQTPSNGDPEPLRLHSDADLHHLQLDPHPHPHPHPSSLDPTQLLKEEDEKEKMKNVVSQVNSNISCYIACTSECKEEEEEEEKKGMIISGVKKRRSPAVLMEGSRCSRVNGRGWRCCQQTLVGYSLCEHHLGKGRLRTVNSVRGQIGSTETLKSSSDENGAKKNKKMGTVKARSINSLLGD
ncbi:Growth-regulating factor protein [Dioscorea alata]|uniref:Growth-regulating factor protein n=1 Tax=Dioscorea alata TaxID=55571 RepID=A0ACB7U7E9_DIOAL|nr:Growth-regulating factor protein [Dioscorea alata]